MKLAKLCILIIMFAFAFNAFTIPSFADWETKNGKAYYQDESGDYITGWQTIDGNKYYFNKKGQMVTGKVLIGETYYKFGKNGVYKGKYTGVIKSGGRMSFWNKGKVVKDKYVTLKDGKRYYAYSNGYLTPVMPDGTSSGKYSIVSPNIIMNNKSYILYSVQPFGYLQEKNGKYLSLFNNKEISYADLFSKENLVGTVSVSKKPKKELETRYVDDIRNFDGCKVYSNGEITLLLKNYTEEMEDTLKTNCLSLLDDDRNINRNRVMFAYAIYDPKIDSFVDLYYKYNNYADVL